MRETRFRLKKFLARSSPWLTSHQSLNFEMADWKELSQTPLQNWILRSEEKLAPQQIDTIGQDFNFEASVCQGVVHDQAVWHFTIGCFRHADIFGSSGQAIDRASKLSLTFVNHNTKSKFDKSHVLRVKTPVINLISFSKNFNYYHFLIEESAININILDYIGAYLGGVTALVRPPSNDVVRIFRRALEKKYPKVQFLEVQPNELVQCDQLWQHRVSYNCKFRYPSRRSDLDTLRVLLQSECLSDTTKDMPPWRLLYITRRDARVRRVQGEQKLTSMITQLGFEVVCPGDLHFKDQVRLFSEARFVVSVHGAGLSNIIFMPEGGKVLEIFGNRYVQSAYFWLSFLRQLEYEYLLARQASHHQHVIMTESVVDQIYEKLKVMLD